MRRLFVPSLITLVLTGALAGCTNVTPRTFGKGDTGVPDTDADTDSDTDTDTDTDTSETGDTGSPSSGFDDPGDVVEFTDTEGVAQVELTDASGDSNQGQEFYLVVVNTTSAEVGYRLRYYDATQTSPERPGLPGATTQPPRRAPMPRLPAGPPAAPPPPAALEIDDVGSARDEFLVRDRLEDTTSYTTVSATLWALGDNVAIWVDDDVPIDWDVDCDGVVDVEHEYSAYGFDNCDLADVAEIIDSNIIPNVRALYGEESDIDGDGRVAVVITPVLNQITRSSDDEADWSRVLASYAEPNVDLAEFHYTDNPGSDMQEVLYVFAPDPNGYFNRDVQPTVDTYTGYQLAAEVARSFTTLVSYNQHHLLRDGPVEEDWLNDVLGTFAAEYCGFGVNYYEDAWEYLDLPHGFPLASDAALGSLATFSRGAQYLFGLWLYEQAEAQSAGSGATLLASIVQTDETGVTAVETAVSGSGATFSSLVLGWQVALLTSGVTNVGGAPLVDAAEWVPYPDAQTISAPPGSPGNWYGANGYQRGLDLHGTNHAFRYGTTDAPTEITEQLVKLENTDAYIYTPGFAFSGWMDGNYSAQAVRLTGIAYDEAQVVLQATGSGLVGAVVRWNDPTTSDVAIENIFSSTEANPVALPTLPDDGTVIHGMGNISESFASYSQTEDGIEEIEVQDTDRWLLDLTDRPSSDSVEIAVWLDRQFSDTNGDMGPDDPWIAVAPRELVPEPSSEGTYRDETCAGSSTFIYPTLLPEHLAAQLFLSSSMYSGDEDDFDACGAQAASETTCADDWDRDGVRDEDEPVPSTFLEQARVMECTQNGNVEPESWTYGSDWLDADERDSDANPTMDLTHNTGGHSGVIGEEGYVRLSLEGGREYLIVVGANANGTGTYELSVRQIE